MTLSRVRPSRPAEGWLTLALVAGLALIVAWAVDDPRWVNGKGELTDVLGLCALGGVAVGFAGPKVGWGRWTTHLVGALFAALLLPVFAGWAMVPGSSPGAAFMTTAAGTIQAYLDIAWLGLPFTRQEVHYVLVLGGIMWATGQFASYSVFGHRRPLNAVVVLGLLLVANMALTSRDRDELAYLIAFTAGSLFLLIGMHAFDERATWIRRRIGDPSTISSLYLRGGTVFILIAVVGSMLLTRPGRLEPAGGRVGGGRPAAGRVRPEHQPPAAGRRGAPSAGRRAVRPVRQDRRHLDHGRRDRVHRDRPEGRGGRQVARDHLRQLPDQRLVADAAVRDPRRCGPARARRHAGAAGRGHDDPAHGHRPARRLPAGAAPRTRRGRHHGPGRDPPGVRHKGLVRKGRPRAPDVAVHGRRALAPARRGAGAGDGSPAGGGGDQLPVRDQGAVHAGPHGAIGVDAQALLDKILAAPPGRPTRTDLAEYMQNYFQTTSDFQYSNDISDRPSCDAGVVECFARIKAGFCLHYASTMAILLRAADQANPIPTRLVQGFLPGEAERRHRDRREPGRARMGRGLLPGLRLDPVRPDRRRVGLPTVIVEGPAVPLPSRDAVRLRSDPTGPTRRASSTGTCRDSTSAGTPGGGRRRALAAHRCSPSCWPPSWSTVAFAAWLRGPRGDVAPGRGMAVDGARPPRASGSGRGPPRPSTSTRRSLGDLVPVAQARPRPSPTAKVETSYAGAKLAGSRLDEVRAAARRLRISLLRLAVPPADAARAARAPARPARAPRSGPAARRPRAGRLVQERREVLGQVRGPQDRPSAAQLHDRDPGERHREHPEVGERQAEQREQWRP